MNHDLELAYLGIEVPDPAVLSPFFADVIGLLPGAASKTVPSTITWRDDDKVHRVMVSRGSANDATVLGLEASNDDTFERTTTRLRKAGYEVREGTSLQCGERRVSRLVGTSAPWGVDVELVAGLERAPTPFESPLVPGGFHTDGVGFGHTVFATMAFDESDRFLVAGLGFVQSDWLVTEIMEGIELEVHFYHCNERHHSIALARAPFELPQTFHHVMFETNERDDVGAAFDRVWASGLGIANGLGRHDNDKMFSFYVVSPSGFQVEVGHGARIITDDWDDNRRYDRISAWGHQPLRVGPVTTP